jgi:hypothetical protein
MVLWDVTLCRSVNRYWRFSCGICGGQSGAGAGFLRVLRFPLPIFIPSIAPQSPSSIIWGLYNRPEVAAVPRDLVPPHKKNILTFWRNLLPPSSAIKMEVAGSSETLVPIYSTKQYHIWGDLSFKYVNYEPFDVLSYLLWNPYSFTFKLKFYS